MLLYAIAILLYTIAELSYVISTLLVSHFYAISTPFLFHSTPLLFFTVHHCYPIVYHFYGKLHRQFVILHHCYATLQHCNSAAYHCYSVVGLHHCYAIGHHFYAILHHCYAIVRNWYVIVHHCYHWRRLIKNTWGGKTEMEEMWYKLINTWAFPDFFLGAARSPGFPQSLRLWLLCYRPSCSLLGWRVVAYSPSSFVILDICHPRTHIAIDDPMATRDARIVTANRDAPTGEPNTSGAFVGVVVATWMTTII